MVPMLLRDVLYLKAVLGEDFFFFFFWNTTLLAENKQKQ